MSKEKNKSTNIDNTDKDNKITDNNLKEMIGDEYIKSLEMVKNTDKVLDLLLTVYHPKNIIAKIDTKIAKEAIKNDTLTNYKRFVTVSNLPQNVLLSNLNNENITEITQKCNPLPMKEKTECYNKSIKEGKINPIK